MPTPEKPQRAIGDKTYDNKLLDQQLPGQGSEMIVPHRANRKTVTQDL